MHPRARTGAPEHAVVQYGTKLKQAVSMARFTYRNLDNVAVLHTSRLL